MTPKGLVGMAASCIVRDAGQKAVVCLLADWLVGWLVGWLVFNTAAMLLVEASGWPPGLGSALRPFCTGDRLDACQREAGRHTPGARPRVRTG